MLYLKCELMFYKSENLSKLIYRTHLMGLIMVMCLIGFMGILGFMGTITLSSRNQSPHRMVFFTFHFSLFQFFNLSIFQSSRSEATVPGIY